MTLDEAIERYTNNAEHERTHGNLQGCVEFRQLAEWLKDYKRLLDQESCGDTISRRAAQAKIKSICDEYRLSYEDGERKAATGGSAYALGHAFDDLPPVTPQPKMGKWIKSRDSYGNNHFTCPFCEHDIATKYAGTWNDNYCSNCGARLEVEK